MKFFLLKSQTIRLGQTIWADKLWGIWGIFGQSNSTHLSTVSPLSMFSIIQPLFLQKVSLYIHIPNIYLASPIFIWDWNLNLGRKDLGI